MEDLKKKLNELLASYDSSREPLSEMEVSAAIMSLRAKEDKADPPFEWVAEAMAFDFYEDLDNRAGASTYFRPKATLRNEDGSCIEYWTQRCRAITHPVLRARYANLVWDLQRTVSGTSPDYRIAQIAIDSIIEIAQTGCHKYEVDVIGKLRHALSLAISLNDSSRMERVRDTIVGYEAAVAVDDKPGLWGFAYDLLWDNAKAVLSTEQRDSLLADLERRLDRLVRPASDKTPNPWAAEFAAVRLATQYQKLGRKDDVRRVLLDFGGAFENMASKASALQAMAWLEHVHSVYREFGLNEDAERITVRLREIGPKSAAEMKPISATVEISKKEMEDYVAAFSRPSIEDMLSLIAWRFIPRKAEIEDQLKKLSQKAPLAFLLSSKLQDERGRPVASIGSLEGDIDGNIAKYMSQNLATSTIFLRAVMNSLPAKSGSLTKGVATYVFQSPIFEESKRPIIEQGIDDYFAGRYLSAVHLIMPQLEDAVRLLLEKSGGSVFKQNRTGGFDLKTLNELLREPLVSEVLSEDMTLYLRILLVDPRGWNLRNNVCHGLMPANAFGPQLADRVIHALLCLAQVREHGTTEK